MTIEDIDGRSVTAMKVLYDDQKEKGKIYLQNTTHKTEDRAPKIPLKTGIELMDSG
jgi:hypothetical protein